MKVKISSQSAASCLLLPSPINVPKKSTEALVPLPLQHRTVRRRWLQRRRFRAKAMIRPIISAETTTEDEIPETEYAKGEGNRQLWNLAPESSTDDPEPDDTIDDQPKTIKRKRRSADEQTTKSETKNNLSKPKVESGITGKISTLLESATRKKRLHGDVASLVSPMRSSKRQRFSFSV